MKMILDERGKKYVLKEGQEFQSDLGIVKADVLENASDLIDNLLRDIKEQSSQRKYAEESIVYANQYRQGFLDCKYALNNAGTSFFESDFTRTIEETVAIIKKMRPDVNK